MKINQYLTSINRTEANRSGVQYIVVHYVGATGGALANCKYYASRYVGASAHYFVGHQGEIYQSVLDKDVAWHCGGNKYPGTAGGSVYGICTNGNSIGVEMCCRKNPWRFEQATVDSTVELVKFLMAQYNVPKNRVVRHYDVVGKTCPAPYVDDSAMWRQFISRLDGSLSGGDGSSSGGADGGAGGDEKLVAEYQQVLNSAYGKNLVVDNIYGANTEAAAVTIRRGSRGDIVTILQRLLSSRTNYFGGAWDGIFGKDTEAAVRTYQQQKGLGVDGIVGRDTWRALLMG